MCSPGIVRLSGNADGEIQRIGRGGKYNSVPHTPSVNGTGAPARHLSVVGTDRCLQAGWMCHRTDLHDELKRLAFGMDGAGPPATLHLGHEVVSCDPVAATLTLKNGDVRQGDLIVGADGIHVRLVAVFFSA